MIKNNKGFTLIELLVVIAIIGLLATLTVASLNSARSKSRDAKVVSDIKQIQTALELYNNDNGHYPDGPAGAGFCLDGTNGFLDPSVTPCTEPIYLKSYPVNPTTGGAFYSYNPDPNASAVNDSYHLIYQLENPMNGICGGAVATAGVPHNATPAAICDGG
jgi:general secretion pathway protein G